MRTSFIIHYLSRQARGGSGLTGPDARFSTAGRTFNTATIMAKDDEVNQAKELVFAKKTRKILQREKPKLGTCFYPLRKGEALLR
jgi:hypothetical protein